MKQIIEKRIERKRAEIQELERKILEAKAYLKALDDVKRSLLSDQPSGKPVVLGRRKGTDLARAREAILKAGRPLHINELLKILGKEMNKKNRVSLSGNMAAYVRSGKVFTRPAPSTYGLLESKGDSAGEEAAESADPSNTEAQT